MTQKTYPNEPLKQRFWRRFVLHRNQAKFRKETYELSFEDFYKFCMKNIDKIIVGPLSKNTYQITRKDKSKPWSKNNISLRKRRITYK